MMNRSQHQPFDMSDETDRARALAAVLGWYQAMGADAAVAAEATNWLERGQVPPQRIVPVARAASTDIRQDAPRAPERPAQPAGGRATPSLPAAAAASRAAPPSAPQAAVPSVTISDELAEAQARAVAGEAGSLAELRAALLSFEGCGLKKTAKNLCFFRGAERARVMIIGDVPRAEEDRAGVPFVGPLGQLLDRMLKAIKLPVDDVHLTQCVYWRPPGNRLPTAQEILICRPFLERQIRLVEPQLIVTLGGSAAKSLLGTTKSILKVRGKWSAIELPADGDFGAIDLPVLPTLHPDYLLSSPLYKRHAWKDLLALKARLEG